MSTGDRERPGEKVLSNGDTYVGGFDGFIPHGTGKYIWLDGTCYEGEWERSKITGRGQISWPSGTTFEGELHGGFLHGSGKLYGCDGSIYNGSWGMNANHGVGTKTYANSDTYDGLWREGLRSGIGRYKWSNGNTYIGNWKAGKMCGRGVMKWANGDLFNGHWLDGFQHGLGYYKFEDGSYYIGTWNKGMKDGRGTFYPAGSTLPHELKLHGSVECYDDNLRRSLSLNSSTMVTKKIALRSKSLRMWNIGSIFRHSGRVSHRTSFDGTWDPNNSMALFSSQDNIITVPHPSNEGKKEHQEDTIFVYEREYIQGVLVTERTRTRMQSSSMMQKKCRCMTRKQKKGSGETVHKGHKNFYLMLNLQLGIRYTVGKITPVPMREARPSDFGPLARIEMYFPKKGSQFTPPHNSIGFSWKDYCPMVFRNLREMFKIDAADYMMSICGGDGLKELSSPGKSGSIFYISQDERFVIKTLKKFELKILLKMLPNYYGHVRAYDNTLITKFFGLHRITIRSGRKVRFVVMGNMFCSELEIHHRYDLKGSTLGRSTDKQKVSPNTTLKDLDLSYVFHLEQTWRESLFRQLSLDCIFLESQRIIDYSMLLGLHFRAPECLKAPLESEDAPCASAIPWDHASDTSLANEAVVPPKGLLLVTHEPNDVRNLPGSHIRGNTLRASAVDDREVDLLLPGTGRLPVQLGVNMPAQAKRLLYKEVPDSSESNLHKIYDVVIYLGIIDILQEYNMRKRIEHAYKSIRFGPMSISAVEPKLYSRRLINFLESVFPE